MNLVYSIWQLAASNNKLVFSFLFPFAEYPVVPACQAGIGGQVATGMKATGEPSEALAKEGGEASGNEYKIEIPCAPRLPGWH